MVFFTLKFIQTTVCTNYNDGRTIVLHRRKIIPLSDDLVDTSKFDPSDLKLDIKSGKILVFITLFMLTGVNMIERFLI